MFGLIQIYVLIALCGLTIGQATQYRHKGSYGGASNIPKQCLEVVHEWEDLEYDFPNERIKEHAIRKGDYVAGNGVPIDVAAYYRKDGTRRVFTTIPRFTTGIPFSLAVVSSRRTGPKGPILKPYPSYEWHSSHGKNCDGITSVFRVAIDPCKRLWVLDTGKVGDIQYCRPQLLIFDLSTDNLLHRYRFPESQYVNASLFITPIVDVRDPPPLGQCRHSKVYIADVTGYGILVYDSVINTSWRTENQLMHNTPENDTFTIAGESFQLQDGAFGLSVTPTNVCKSRNGCERKLYFHALANHLENEVPLDVMDDRKMWTKNVRAKPDEFKTVGTRIIQNAAMAMDSEGNLFSSPMEPIGISSWNIKTPYTTNSMKVINAETLQFISGMKVVRNRADDEELWVNSNRFQRVMAGTINHNETNFRILKGLTSDILSGPC